MVAGNRFAGRLWLPRVGGRCFDFGYCVEVIPCLVWEREVGNRLYIDGSHCAVRVAKRNRFQNLGKLAHLKKFTGPPPFSVSLATTHCPATSKIAGSPRDRSTSRQLLHSRGPDRNSVFRAASFSLLYVLETAIAGHWAATLTRTLIYRVRNNFHPTITL